MSSFLVGLPKVELHVHLEGTLEPELRAELARRNGLPVPEALAYDFDSLASFLAVYYPAMDVLREEADFYDLASAYFRRAAADGVVRVEAFFDPQAHTSRGVPFEAVIGGYHRAAVDAAALGVDASLILCFLRDMSAESAGETLEAALPFADRLIGVGLDSDERGNPPAKFAPVFARAREAGLRLTMHCDVDQPNGVEHIRQALEEIGVDRIDHGTNIVEAPELVQVLVDRGLALTCCPLSNSFVSSDMKAGEMRGLLERGVRVTVNSDDPAYFGGYIADNYAAMEAAGFTRDELVQLARNSVLGSWADASAQEALLARIDAYAVD
ncbi:MULTISPECIES: adenosine deaminase [unclassified Rathayibacter]|uniref:adenosine deaminase n=1 Tax=unclassified Rathayibacter TaxID=2609250 RepID=UPI0006FD88DE|nr:MULTISPECIES: adenosine deaminase [unclassified Rathayibacter]KQQ00003.1 adenosine deaminase [Rathayibacter sp. Leaf294]KQS09457.1 adenosine deaminase [Rathayibacter sp. Leaf185]